MRFLDKRILGICNELEKLSVVEKEKVTEWKYKKGTYVYPKDVETDESSWEDFDSNTMHWYGPDEHYWFKTTITVPKNFDGKALWLKIRTQIDEWDDGKNPQFLIFVNDVETQGVDMNHREVLITKEAKAGETYRIDLQSYTGTLHSEFNLLADMQQIDPDITALYYDLKMPISAFDRMEEDDPNRMQIEEILNTTINFLDLRQPYNDLFYASLKEAEDYIQDALYGEHAGYDDIIATCIGHTHIDVAWWWTVEQTREKVGRSFATVLKLMEEYPNYKFMSSQPQLYSFLKERYPKLYGQIKERVAEGRWEPEGGMWVEADCNLTSGESLVRQFLHGKKFFKEEFGVDNKVLWLPDVFGYSGALPQIMKRSGIEYFMTTKLAWNQINKMPHDTLIWRGIDGSEILTHLITTLGVGQSTDDFFTTYNGMLHPDAIMGGWQRYQNKKINNDILISYGYGDGGGGPTREMLETSKRMEKGVKGIPKVRQEGSLTYFKELEERVIDNPRLPLWEGEFYFEYHRGTYTSMARNKRSNRKSELMLMDLELIRLLADQEGTLYPFEALDKIWKTVLLNQFHDILPGSSIKEVYEVTKKEYAEIEEQVSTLMEEGLTALESSTEGMAFVNTTGFSRDDVISIGQVEGKSLKDDQGQLYPIQSTQEGGLVYLEDLPSKGYKNFQLTTESTDVKTPFIIQEGSIETPYYRISLDKNGLMTSIFDKENDREVLQKEAQANLFRMYEDKPIYYDNWDIDMYYTEKSWDVLDITRCEWKDVGPYRATLEIERHVSASIIIQKIYFYSNKRRIDFETYVDWKEHQHLLKVHFPVDIHTDEATFDIQFGNLTRKVHQNTSWDEARFESCGQKWMDLSEGDYGVSLLNDCKYGHSVKDSNMALTLIKSGIEPNPTTDQEEHYFTYSLYPHQGNWRQGHTVREAYFLNQPVRAWKGNLKDQGSKVAVNHENVIIETVKKAENGQGTIVRLYEAHNSKTKATLSFEGLGHISKIYECNLMEEKEEEMAFDAKTFNFEIKPYEVKTYLLEK